jgi:hypothetical protein
LAAFNTLQWHLLMTKPFHRFRRGKPARLGTGEGAGDKAGAVQSRAAPRRAVLDAFTRPREIEKGVMMPAGGKRFGM